jgi:hypothetical protein
MATTGETLILEERRTRRPTTGLARLYASDRRDWLRLIGGILFATGAVILALRRGGSLPDAAEWSDVAIFGTLFIPFVVLYGLGISGAVSGREAEPWQSVFLVFGTILAPFMLCAFLDVVGGDSDNSLHSIWIFGLTAALGAFAAWYAGATQAGAVAAVAGVIVWLAFWDEVLTDPSGETVRWLLVSIALIYLIGTFLLDRSGVRQGASLVTVAGLALILAGSLGALESLGGLDLSGPGPTESTVNGADQNLGWDIVLIASATLLIGFSALTGRRGPGLVGGIGLIGFIFLVGGEVVDQAKGVGDAAATGWPMALLIIGGIAIVLSFLVPLGALGRRR